MQQLFATPFLASGAVTVDLDFTMVAHLVMFTAFVVIMKDLIFDPLLRVFEERERRTAGAIDKARSMDEQAIALKQDYEEKLDGIRREAAGDRERARAKIKKLQAEMMTTARQALDPNLSEGIAKFSDEARSIRSDLTAETGNLAATIASRVLGREVSS